MSEPADGPGWTDFTPSDPGITLLQLFAFLAEAFLAFALVAALRRRRRRRVRATARKRLASHAPIRGPRLQTR